MSFCLRPNVCKKCGKPLTMFEGWTCLECEYDGITRGYTRFEPIEKNVIEQIRAEIDNECKKYDRVGAICCGLNVALAIIDRYTKGE